MAPGVKSCRLLAFAAIMAAFTGGESWGGEPQPHLGLPPLAAVSGNPQAIEKIALGRRLFFDARLSGNGQVSCATCHQPERAFSDARALASGIEGRAGTRNTPTVINSALHEAQFWDGRRGSLEEQAQEPFVNPAEHGLPDHGALLAILNRDDAYAREFRAAFGLGDEPIVLEHVVKALATFIRSLAAGDSPFDRYAYANDATALDGAAKRGLGLFRGRAQCAVCHVLGERHAAFTDNRFHSIGVGLDRLAPKLGALATRVAGTPRQDIDKLVVSDPDVAALGRFVVTRDPADIGRFRTPTLRNVALTAPYMHDGSVATLAEAVDHELYYRGQSLGRLLILTPAEKSDLVAFLRSLTSSTLPR